MVHVFKRRLFKSNSKVTIYLFDSQLSMNEWLEEMEDEDIDKNLILGFTKSDYNSKKHNLRMFLNQDSLSFNVVAHECMHISHIYMSNKSKDIRTARNEEMACLIMDHLLFDIIDYIGLPYISNLDI